jgi:hypothetical protein
MYISTNKLLVITHYINFKSELKQKLIAAIGIEHIDFTKPDYSDDASDKIRQYSHIINFEETYDPRTLMKGRFGKQTTVDGLYALFDKKNVYPSPAFQWYTDSKYYYKDLPGHYGDVFIYDGHDDALVTALSECKWKHYVVKTGYTGEKQGFHEVNETNDYSGILNDCKQLWTTMKYIVPVIIQPWNPIVANRKSEYRCFVVDGKVIKYHAHGTMIQNGRRVVIKNSKYISEIGELALKGYNFIKEQFPECFFLRVDITYDQDGNYYINEIENLDATMYFGLTKTQWLMDALVSSIAKWYKRSAQYLVDEPLAIEKYTDHVTYHTIDRLDMSNNLLNVNRLMLQVYPTYCHVFGIRKSESANAVTLMKTIDGIAQAYSISTITLHDGAVNDKGNISEWNYFNGKDPYYHKYGYKLEGQPQIFDIPFDSDLMLSTLSDLEYGLKNGTSFGYRIGHLDDECEIFAKIDVGKALAIIKLIRNGKYALLKKKLPYMIWSNNTVIFKDKCLYITYFHMKMLQNNKFIKQI